MAPQTGKQLEQQKRQYSRGLAAHTLRQWDALVQQMEAELETLVEDTSHLNINVQVTSTTPPKNSSSQNIFLDFPYAPDDDVEDLQVADASSNPGDSKTTKHPTGQ
jgi:hypothetical protein